MITGVLHCSPRVKGTGDKNRRIFRKKLISLLLFSCCACSAQKFTGEGALTYTKESAVLESQG